jgi:periplasmic divalent cation tolerance protein
VAARIARVAVEERVAAAVNIVPGLRSVFVWEGRVEEAAEWLLVIKSRIERLGALEARVRALHPYRVPSLVALPVVGGDGTYLAWIADRVRTKGGGEPDEE